MANIKQPRRQSKSKPKVRAKAGQKAGQKARSKAKASAKDPQDDFDRARARLDKKKRIRELKTHWAHFWNVCPKCGEDMFEQTSLKIRYEVCRKCPGIYVDQAEAALVSNRLDVKKWLRAILRRSKDPKTS